MTSTAVATPQIFICYRHTDHGPAGRLSDRLKNTFGTHAVFFDVDGGAISPGDPFPPRIDDAIRRASVVLVVIGAGWAAELSKRASDCQIDYVLREVELALNRRRVDNIRVIPVCVDAAPMPQQADLAPDLQMRLSDLLTLQATTFRRDQDWEPTYAVLEKGIHAHLLAIDRLPDAIDAPSETRLLLATLDKELRTWVRETLDDADLAERRLFKPLSLAGGVERTMVLAEIDRNLRHERHILRKENRTVFITGEEGTGKTITVAQWLQRSIDGLDFGVLYTSAQESYRWPLDPVEFLRHGLQQRAGDVVTQLDALRRDNALDDWTSLHPWLVIVDGINEEGTAREWGERISGFSSQTGAGITMLLTTRTEHLERRLRSYRKNATTIVVPDFSTSELKTLLRQHSLQLEDIPPEAIRLLHRPRYFRRALKHRHALAGLRSLDAPLLIFLDWRERAGDRLGSPLSFADFERLLLHYARNARDLRAARLGRGALRDSFSADDEPAFARKIDELLEQRVIRDNAEGLLEINSGLLPIALGLLLLEKLHAHPAQSRIELREVAAGWLGDHQDDLRGEICHAAVVAALSRGDIPSEVTIALLERWLTSQNAQEQPISRSHDISPLAGMRRLYEVAASEVFALIEWMLSEGRASYMLNAFAEMLIDVAQDPGSNNAPVANTLHAWLGMHSPPSSAATATTELANYAERKSGAQQLDACIAEVSLDMRSCRLLALVVLSQIPSLLTAAGLRRTLLSIAVEGFTDDLERLCWVLRVVRQDFLDEIRRLIADCNTLPALQAAVVDVASRVWPVRLGYECDAPSNANSAQAWYLELRNRLLHRVPQDGDMAELRAACRRYVIAITGYLRNEIGFAIALYLPELFVCLQEDVTKVALYGSDESDQLARWLAQAAPLLTADQTRRSRMEVRWRRRKAVRPAQSSSDLALAGHWQQRPPFRAAYISLRAAAGEAIDSEIAAADLDLPGRRLLARRIVRSTRPGATRALFHVLNRTEALSCPDVSMLLQWVRRIDPARQPEDARDTVIHWLIQQERFDDAARLIPSGWAYADGGAQARNWSRVLAASGQLTLHQAMQRLSTNDLPRWACYSRATLDEWRQVGRLIDAVLDDDDPLNWPAPVVPVASDDWLRDELRRLRTTGQIQQVLEDEWPAYAIRAHLSDTMRRFVRLDIANLRRAKGFLHAVVDGAIRYGDEDAISLLRTLWAAEDRSGKKRGNGYTRDVVSWAFRLADTPESRQLWDDIADELRTDDELVRFVACAQIGNGEAWLRQRIAARLGSPLPGQEVEAAVLAGAAGFADVMRDIGRRIDGAHGWRRTGLMFAMELDRDLRDARAWHRRFYKAKQWTTAYGAFMAYLKLVDARLAILGETRAYEYRGDPDMGQARYHYTWREEVDEAVKRRQKTLQETLFGDALPTPHLGRWAHMRKLL